MSKKMDAMLKQALDVFATSFASNDAQKADARKAALTYIAAHGPDAPDMTAIILNKALRKVDFEHFSQQDPANASLLTQTLTRLVTKRDAEYALEKQNAHEAFLRVHGAAPVSEVKAMQEYLLTHYYDGVTELAAAVYCYVGSSWSALSAALQMEVIKKFEMTNPEAAFYCALDVIRDGYIDLATPPIIDPEAVKAAEAILRLVETGKVGTTENITARDVMGSLREPVFSLNKALEVRAAKAAAAFNKKIAPDKNSKPPHRSIHRKNGPT